MDYEEVIKSKSDDNWVSTGPHVALKPSYKTSENSAGLPLSQNFHQNPCRISIKSEICTNTALANVHLELLPPIFL